ncbi:MAG: DUF3306 domain-containing protein [Rhodospirillales bacterium]
MSTNDNDGVLSRWSRRKATSRRGRAAPVAVEETAAIPDVETLPSGKAPDGALATAELPIETDEQAESAPEEEIDVADLPDVETLDKDSDFTPFLRKGVPEAISRAALRKLWLSDAVFANLDGLNDYDQNFRVIDKLISLADTNYKVGKGFLTDDSDGETETEPETETETETETEVAASEADGDGSISREISQTDNDEDLEAAETKEKRDKENPELG